MGRIFESCDFDGRILVMTFGKPICGSSRREKEKKPLLPPHKNWLKKVPLLCLKGYKSMKWDFRRAVIDACNYFHACPNSTGCLDIAYTTHAPTTAGATEILLPQIQISSLSKSRAKTWHVVDVSIDFLFIVFVLRDREGVTKIVSPILICRNRSNHPKRWLGVILGPKTADVFIWENKKAHSQKDYFTVILKILSLPKMSFHVFIIF